MEDFRQGVLGLANKSVDIMGQYLEGSIEKADKIKEVSMMIREGVKVSNRDQVDNQVKRSQAIRLLSFIPKDRRDEYIAFTNPETKPFLLPKPEKKK